MARITTVVGGLLLLCAIPSETYAQYVDTAAHRSLRLQVAWFGLALRAREPIWHGDSLRYDGFTPATPSMGGEVMVWYDRSWSFGISVGTSRSYVDAIHRRDHVPTGDDTWRIHGEHMGLDHRFTMAGVQAVYEPWPYPRRRKVGMSLQLGGGLYYMHLTERRFVIRSGVAEGRSYGYGGTVYTYPEHENMEVLGESKGGGIGVQLYVRGDLHLGRHFSTFAEFGFLESTSFNAEGSQYLTPEGSTLAITPHKVDPSWLTARAGFVFHHWGR